MRVATRTCTISLQMAALTTTTTTTTTKMKTDYDSEGTDLDELDDDELRDLADKMGLAVEGSREELINRILDAQDEDSSGYDDDDESSEDTDLEDYDLDELRDLADEMGLIDEGSREELIASILHAYLDELNQELINGIFDMVDDEGFIDLEQFSQDALRGLANAMELSAEGSREELITRIANQIAEDQELGDDESDE
ncbi:hypothetical protein T492DRAFT_1032767 [Pavlovales sp. CCMP2436]|nr:hypothetical protein T492DRAFT_1032767 [Pavlovales sp. CCMP2436]